MLHLKPDSSYLSSCSQFLQNETEEKCPHESTPSSVFLKCFLLTTCTVSVQHSVRSLCCTCQPENRRLRRFSCWCDSAEPFAFPRLKNKDPPLMKWAEGDDSETLHHHLGNYLAFLKKHPLNDETDLSKDCGGQGNGTAESFFTCTTGNGCSSQNRRVFWFCWSKNLTQTLDHLRSVASRVTLKPNLWEK